MHDAPSSGIEWNGAGFSVLPGRETHPMVTVRWPGAAIEG